MNTSEPAPPQSSDRPRTESVDSMSPQQAPEPPPNDGQEQQEDPEQDGDPDHRRRIVVGIDGSDAAAAAVSWAVGQARHSGAVIHAVAVWQQPRQFGVSAAQPAPRQAFQTEAGQWLTTALPTLEPDEAGAEIHTYTEEGDPSSVLLEHAVGAELLVLGNHGRGALTGALVGSVAQRCTHRSPCPVVLVPRQRSDRSTAG